MTEAEREELIEKMAKAAWESDGAGCRWEIVVQKSVRNEWLREARAALAVAEPVIREQADNVLREENARLREALKPFANELKEQKVEVPHVTEDERFIYSYTLRVKHLRAAAAAIREGGKDG